MFDRSRSRLLTLGLLALGATPAALLVAAVAHVGFCHADPHALGDAVEPLCCEVIEITAHGHHHSEADAEHAHPAVAQRVVVVVTAASLPSPPAPVVAAPDGPRRRPAAPPRDPPPSDLFLSTHALLL